MKTNYLKTLLLAALFCGWGTMNSFADDEDDSTDETTTTINYVTTTINSADASQQDVTYTFKGNVTAAGLTYDTTTDAVGTVYNGSDYSKLYASTTSGLDRIAYTSCTTINDGNAFWWRSSSYGIVMRGGSCGFAVTDLKAGNKVTFIGTRFTTSGYATFYGATSVDGVEQTVYNGTNAASHTVTSTDDGVEVSVTSDGYVAFWGTGTSNSSYYITSITITEDADVNLFPYTYKIKYVDTDGNEIKSSKTCYSASSDATVSASDAEKANITDDEGNTYVYSEEETTSSEITLTGSDDVITLVFEKTAYTYEIIAVDEEGSTIMTLATIYSNDESYSYSGLQQVIKNDGTYYELSDESVTSYSKTFSYSDGTFSVTYKANEDIVYFADFSGTEATDASGGSYYSGTYLSDLSSRSYSASSGYYKASVSVYKDGNSRGVKITLGGTQVGSKQYGTGIKNFYVNVVDESGTITLTGGNDNQAGANVDYLIIYKVSNYSDTVSVTSVGIATFSAPVAVEVPSGIRVYSASLDDEETTLTLTKVSTDVIPANTGVILQGEENDYIFSQTESESTEGFSSNSLIAASATATASTTLTAESGYYVLTNSDGEAVFGLVAADITIENKAYLQLETESSDDDEDTSSEAKTISIVFAETTGIESVSSEKATDGSYYNLQGVKVLSPSKGLYIKDGKKVIIK